MFVRAGPGFYCNNDAWPNTTDGGVMVARHTVSLAAYMLARGAASYFSSGLHWTDLVPGTALKAWPYWGDYAKACGDPLGPMTRHDFVFTRAYENLDVTLDCGTITARLDWRGGEAVAARGL